ncbi:zinc finger protein 800-like [Coregonus clupeaformis]|uniref:zinc finger protein 800-like n=1 Tax=Coregonus clupeaformis TaxID=59861 RepID=UPI001E1C2D56|nr:zinc finger protein 800-like [Coregonus clupeaformis]
MVKAKSAPRKTSQQHTKNSSRMEVEMEEILQSEPQDEPQPEPESHATRDQCCQTDEPQPSSPNPMTDLNPGPDTAPRTPGYCVEPGDPPLLQQQLQTSKSGIQQIIECFRSGTAQLKHMLLNEADTIFECKMCRSLFRGLPNLITHKEHYCLTRLPKPDDPAGNGDKQSVAMKDLLESIYPRKDRPDYVMRLEPIQTSNNAVFQFLSSEEELAHFPRAPHTPGGTHTHSPEPWEEQGGTPENGQTGGEVVAQPEEEGSTSGVEDVTISCCLCGKDFNSRRSIRRHCRKMHQTKLEELRKFTETRTVPISLLSMVKGRPRTLHTPSGKSCPVCFKSFATKANVRRHFDEVHRGLRRDTITPDIATRPGQPLSLEATPPRKSANSSPTRDHTPKSGRAAGVTTPQPPNASTAVPPAPSLLASALYNLASCRCLLCKRKYSSQVMLKRHMRIVHKIYNLKNVSSVSATSTATTATSKTTTNTDSTPSNSTPSNNLSVKEKAVEPCDDPDSSPASSPGDTDRKDTDRKGVAVASKSGQKIKEEEGGSSPKTSTRSTSINSTGGTSSGSSTLGRTPQKLSVGFDFKQLFCKLCKRQFSSRQNLTKHIELHTDGTDIFIKFYRCPLCRYESRRKRDVLRHVTVVHKKSTGYLAKIVPKLESRAVKRPAEVVLNSPPNSNNNKRGGTTEEVNGCHSPPSPPTPPVTRKQELLNNSSNISTSSYPVTRKQDLLSSTPVTRNQERQQEAQTRSPVTRKNDKQQPDTTAPTPPHTRRHDAHQESSSSSTEVRVTKNFSLHACDVCGRAFAKKLYLESHKRIHRNITPPVSTPPSDARAKGVSTRSKALL